MMRTGAGIKKDVSKNRALTKYYKFAIQRLELRVVKLVFGGARFLLIAIYIKSATGGFFKCKTSFTIATLSRTATKEIRTFFGMVFKIYTYQAIKVEEAIK